MTDKQIIIDGLNVLKEKINMCLLLLINKFETSETIKRTIYEHLDVFVKKCNKQLVSKEQECERLKKYLNQIRDEELSYLDIEWDEYETSARQEDYSNIITLVERALGEIDD